MKRQVKKVSAKFVYQSPLHCEASSEESNKHRDLSVRGPVHDPGDRPSVDGCSGFGYQGFVSSVAQELPGETFSRPYVNVLKHFVFGIDASFKIRC